MAEMTEEEKYRRKAELLKRALVAADEMDKKDSDIEVTFSNNRDAFVINDDVPSGVTLKIPEVIMMKSKGTEIAITIGISLATGIPSSLVAAWLYDKFKQCRSNQISINRRVINLSDGKVTQIIEESIKIE